MRQAMDLALLTAVLVTPAFAEDKGKVDEKLVGTWSIVSADFSGKVLDIPEGAETLFVFTKDGKLTIKDKGIPDAEGTFTVATTKNPKELDLIVKDRKKDDSKKAIYQLDGDTLKIAMPTKSPDRPTSFDSNAAMIMTLKRQKP